MSSDYLKLEPRSEEQARADIANKRDQEALSVAVAWRRIIWQQPAECEDERIERLEAICTKLMDGNKIAGEQLAQRAIWS